MDVKRQSPLARDAMAYVLAGGRGSRLMELTDRRAKPAVYFGGMSRIIDFALSNALNSGIRRIADRPLDGRRGAVVDLAGEQATGQRAHRGDQVAEGHDAGVDLD